MGFRRQRTERHSGTVEARQYFLDRFDFVEWYGRAGRRDFHQVAKRRDGHEHVHISCA